jgi:hypothetical protein
MQCRSARSGKAAAVTRQRGGPPDALVAAVRARIAPLFPDWELARVELLVDRIASVEWRYLAGDDGDHCAQRRPLT